MNPITNNKQMKKNLLNSLLVTLMVLVGGSAWAQTVTTYDFEDGNALFTADSRIGVNVVEGDQTFYDSTFTLDGKAVKFTGANNAQNGYCFTHLDFSSLCEQAAKVKVEFDAVLGNGARSRISIGDASVRGNTGNSSKTTYSNKGAIFMLGTEKSVGYINGTNNAGLLTALTQKWLKVTVEVDEAAKTYTYSIVNKATSEELYNNGESPISFWSSDATNCTQIDFFGYINNSTLGLIDNLIITVTKDERQQADYTVNFLDKNGNAIAEAATRSGAVGDAISLLPADKEAKWNAEGTQKYIYESDNTESLTIAESGTTIVNITYRDAEVFNYTLTSSLGATLNTGSGFEGEGIRVPYPRYQLDGTNLYMAAVDNKEYRTTINLTANNTSKAVTYTLQEGKVAAFYTEAESIEGMTVVSNDNIPVRASNALAAIAKEDISITTLPVGKYIFHTGIFTSKSAYSDLKVNFGIGNRTFAAGFTAVNNNEFASEEYVVAEGTAIKYLASTSANTQFDYIWIEKTGEPTAEELAAADSADQAAAALAEAKAAFLADITAAKAIDTIGKNGVAELAAAITAAETALAAEDATTESLTNAKNALAEAVAAFVEANKPAFDPATAIVNAGFNPEADPLGWDKVTSAQYYDLGMGLIGTYQVRGEHSASTVDETHLATEFAAGLECRWNTNYAAFTQTTAELPAGAYKLTFDVENTNATTTKANYENRFNVTVGETTYADESTEWMDGKSAWTTHTIAFTLTEASPVTISLGAVLVSENEPFSKLYFKADSLMYECKKQGGNTFKFYEQTE